MKIFTSSSQAKIFLKKGSAITMGNYDGVHLGHRKILDSLIREAKKRKLPSVVYTFEPHPVKVLAPQSAPPLLNTLEQKIELLKKCGVDALVIEKFDRAFAHNEPEDFFRKYVMAHLHAQYVIVGYDFTFGAKRRGNIETLEYLCHQNNVDVGVVKPFLHGETLVSSTVIRKHLFEGRVKKVGALLDRPYFIEGKIIRGQGRGKKLGIPTMNLQPENELIPKKGVYATRIGFGKKIFPSITNIGTNPTFGGKHLSLETHIFDFQKRVYGKKTRLFFYERLRDEKTFATPQKLVEQIHKDINGAKKILIKF